MVWKVSDVKSRSTSLWLFGDNDLGYGKKGQAIIRGLKNTCGIPTKKKPTMRPNAFYNDKEFEINCQKISKAFKKVRVMLKLYKYESIVLPIAGFGTGLAEMEYKAPKTLLFLN